MITRILPSKEWSRLNPSDNADIAPFVSALPGMNPINAMVVVVENDKKDIVAHVGVLRVTHLAGLWIDPKYRNVSRRLMKAAFDIAARNGNNFIIADVVSDKMKRVMDRIDAIPLGAQMYAVAIGGEIKRK